MVAHAGANSFGEIWSDLTPQLNLTRNTINSRKEKWLIMQKHNYVFLSSLTCIDKWLVLQGNKI